MMDFFDLNKDGKVDGMDYVLFEEIIKDDEDKQDDDDQQD